MMEYNTDLREVPGERKPVIRDNDDDFNIYHNGNNPTAGRETCI
jgi:hypothetical protein